MEFLEDICKFFESKGVNAEIIKNKSSENDLNNAEFDYVINNNGSIDDLVEEVRKMLIHFKILKNEDNTNTN